jgi:hypothetical protein
VSSVRAAHHGNRSRIDPGVTNGILCRIRITLPK